MRWEGMREGGREAHMRKECEGGRETEQLKQNPNSSYIYDECDIGPNFRLSGPLFLETSHITCPPPYIDLWRQFL